MNQVEADFVTPRWLTDAAACEILERSNEMPAVPAGPPNAHRDDSRDDHRDTHDDHRENSGRDAGSKKKKGGLLGDILGGLGGN